MTPAAPLRVCLYYPWLYLTSGGERTIIEIVRRSRHRFTILTNEYQPDATFPELGDLDVRVLPRVPVDRALGSVARAASRILTQRVDLAGFDAVLVVCEGLGDLFVMRRRRLPAVCLCLTPLRVAFDEHYRARYLDNRPALHRLVVHAGARAFRALDRRAWRRYRRVFAISREVKRRIVEGGLARPERVELLHPGVDVTGFTSGPPSRVFFVPGRIMWTKNLELAIEAFRLFRRTAPGADGWRLCIAGILDRKSEPYLARLRRLAEGDPVDVLIRPSDAEMKALYARCHATLFTAFNEDWGLVLIESMAAGKPPIAVRRGGPLEIVDHDSKRAARRADARGLRAGDVAPRRRRRALPAAGSGRPVRRRPVRLGPVRLDAGRGARRRRDGRRGTGARSDRPLLGHERAHRLNRRRAPGGNECRDERAGSERPGRDRQRRYLGRSHPPRTHPVVQGVCRAHVKE